MQDLHVVVWCCLAQKHSTAQFQNLMHASNPSIMKYMWAPQKDSNVWACGTTMNKRAYSDINDDQAYLHQIWIRVKIGIPLGCQDNLLLQKRVIKINKSNTLGFIYAPSLTLHLRLILTCVFLLESRPFLITQNKLFNQKRESIMSIKTVRIFQMVEKDGQCDDNWVLLFKWWDWLFLSL